MKDINLMPREYVIKAKQRKLILLFSALGSIFVIFIIIGIMFPFRMMDTRRKELADLNEQISDSKYESIREIKEELTQKHKESDLLAELLKQIEKESIISRATLDLLIGFLPPEMYIQKLTANNEEKFIRIEGDAEQAESVSEYVVHLSNLPFVEKIDMKTSSEEVEFNEEVILPDHLEKIQIVRYELTLQMEKEDEEGVSTQDETEVQ